MHLQFVAISEHDFAPSIMAAQGRSHSVLFITSCDRGQANVILSVASEFLQSAPSFDVHIASTASLAPRVEKLHPNAWFHLRPGSSMFESYLSAGHSLHGLQHPPGSRGAISSITGVDRMMEHWKDGKYLVLYETCSALLREIAPQVVVVDPTLAPEIDACRYSQKGIKLVILSPMGLKDLLVPIQPRGGVLWKYPAMSSGFPFPIPAHLILANAWILVRLGLHCFLLSPLFREIAAARKAVGLPGPVPSIGPYVSEGTHYLVPDLPALSLPLDLIPNNVTACGPIVSLPLGNDDLTASGRQLLEWMGGSETAMVLVSFGSHLALSNEDCIALAKGLERALKQHPRLLVLWKRKVPEDDDLASVTAALGDSWTEGRVKMVEWLAVDPAYLLTRPGVVAHVHHGGANAYFETCR